MTDQIEAPRRIATLGMFIIDVFQFTNPTTGEDEGDHGLGDHIGGGGTYFTVGARVWVPSSDLCMVIDRGEDFPSPIQDALEAYDRASPLSAQHSMWRYRSRTDGHGTTRAVNLYKGQLRGFKYLTPKIRLDPHDQLYDYGDVQLLPTYIHFVCSPERARLIVDEVEELLREGKAKNKERPALIWEPIPNSAVPENLDECLEVMKRIDLFSPNHDEAASFLGIEEDRVNLPPEHDGTSADAKMVSNNVRSSIGELIAERFIQLSEISPPSESDQHAFPEKQRRFGSTGPIVYIRSGALGALVAHRKIGSRWGDAYHTPQEAKSGSIKDVTGAGNACLGGFTAALSLNQREIVSALCDDNVKGELALDLLGHCAAYGSVSASYAIEQQGLPPITLTTEGEQRWNGDLPAHRLARLEPVRPDV